jgi:mono/diheme cytochrome c family protein
MLRPLSIAAFLLLFASLLLAQGAKDTSLSQPVPVAEARRPNPVKPTPESIDSGKKTFGYDCAQCHGVAGDGKGQVPKDLKIPDLTNPTTLKDLSDGTLFYRIKMGHAGMPPEGDRLPAGQLWDLVNYVRSLSHAAAEKLK